MITLALLLAAHGDLHEQIVEVTRRIRKDPENARLYLKRGDLRRFHGEWDPAREDYARAVALDPELSEGTALALGKLELAAGRPGPARKALDRFLSARPGDPEGRLQRARALAKLGEHAAAVEDYTRALAAFRTPRPQYYLERADLLAARGRFVEAIRGLDEGIARLGSPVTLVFRAMDLEVERGNHDAALARLDGLLSRFARRDFLLVRRGEILKSAGRAGEAGEAFAAALEEIERLPPARRGARGTRDLERKLRRELEGSR